MKDIIFVTAQPDTPYFHWQVQLYTYNFIQLGINPNNIHVIFSLNQSKKPSKEALELKENGYNVHFYLDNRNVKSYIPSIKPYLVSQFIKEFPMFGKALFLHDSDIIFRELPDFESIMNDDISYLSDTIGYIGYNYIMDCCERYESKFPLSKKGQLLQEMADVVGIDVELIKMNQLNSGGGQYLIKNTTFEMWDKIYKDCTPLYNKMLNYQRRFPIKTGETAFLFLQHFIKILKAGGKAGVVIKNTFLSNTDNASVSLRKLLLENCNLHTVLDLPGGTFTGAGVKTVVLFFEKGNATTKVWFYQLNLDRNLGKTNALNEKDLAEFVEFQKTKKESENSWSINIKDIDKTNFDLSAKNPNKKEETALRTPEKILIEMKVLDEESADILNAILELI